MGFSSHTWGSTLATSELHHPIPPSTYTLPHSLGRKRTLHAPRSVSVCPSLCWKTAALVGRKKTRQAAKGLRVGASGAFTGVPPPRLPSTGMALRVMGRQPKRPGQRSGITQGGPFPPKKSAFSPTNCLPT